MEEQRSVSQRFSGGELIKRQLGIITADACKRLLSLPPSVCLCLTCVFVQGLEENLREAQAAAQRLETHLKQKEKLYEDKIKVGEPESLVEICFRSVTVIVKMINGPLFTPSC